MFTQKVEREVNHLQFQECEDGRNCNHRDWFSVVGRFQTHEGQVSSTKSQETRLG